MSVRFGIVNSLALWRFEVLRLSAVAPLWRGGIVKPAQIEHGLERKGKENLECILALPSKSDGVWGAGLRSGAYLEGSRLKPVANRRSGGSVGMRPFPYVF